jgi:hypothetical protein
MKYLLASILLGTLLMGCSSAPEKGNVTQTAPGGNRNIVSVATEGKITEETATEDAGAVVMTVNPPPLVVVPIQGNTPIPNSTAMPQAREGWQTFTSPTLGVAVDYPVDWSVTEQTDSATFTSPQGTTILLKLVKLNSNNNETMLGNQRCTSRTNAYNLTADICAETVSFSYSAKFTLPGSGSTQGLTLMTTTRAAGTVFESMFNSLRLVK